MKQLIVIGGPMGVGKTAACRELQALLPRNVFLDGDWCWDMRPFQVTAETRRMVMENICFLLNNFLQCSAYDYVLFCWVLHRQEILEELLNNLHTEGCTVRLYSLVCSEEALRARLQRDVDHGIREADCIPRSVERLPLYAPLPTQKVDVTHLTPAQTAAYIAQGL